MNKMKPLSKTEEFMLEPIEKPKNVLWFDENLPGHKKIRPEKSFYIKRTQDDNSIEWSGLDIRYRYKDKWQKEVVKSRPVEFNEHQIPGHEDKVMTLQYLEWENCPKPIYESMYIKQQQREMLIAYELRLWINPTKEMVLVAERLVDNYLNNSDEDK